MKPFFDMSLLVTLSFMSLLLLLGVFLRAKIPFLQKYLIPASLIGAIIGCTLLNTTGFPGVDSKIFPSLAYQLFTLSFIGLGLRGMSKVDKSKGPATKEMLRGSLWQALMWVSSLASQALVATAVIYLLNIATNSDYYPSSGFLAALGFAAGPGQAISTGALWEQYNVPNMSQLAMTFSGLGFVAAFVVGIPLVRWGVKNKLTTYPVNELDQETRTGLLKPDNRPLGTHQVSLPSNVDSMALQAALMLAAWASAYYIVDFCAMRLPRSIGGTLWGLFFLAPMMTGMVIRLIMTKLGIVHLIDGDSMTRFTSWMVELLLMATIIGVKFALVQEYIVPIIVITVVLAVYALFYILYFGRRISGYSFERTVCSFGTCTGTIPTGLILLRMVDSDLKTTVSVEAGMWNLTAFVSFYVNVSMHGYAVYQWGMPKTLAVFAATVIGCFILLKVFGLWGKRQY